MCSRKGHLPSKHKLTEELLSFVFAPFAYIVLRDLWDRERDYVPCLGMGFGHFLGSPGHLLPPAPMFTVNISNKQKILRIKQWISVHAPPNLQIINMLPHLLYLCVWWECMYIWWGVLIVLNQLKIGHRYHDTLSPMLQNTSLNKNIVFYNHNTIISPTKLIIP